jgi:Xaa-Pro dipeptidase
VLIFSAAIDGLLKLGILQGDKEDILKTRTSVAFFPHGLGHYLGMDTVRLAVDFKKPLS